MSKKQTALLKLAKAVGSMLILGTFLFLFVFCTLLPRTTVSNYDTLTKFPEFSVEAVVDRDPQRAQQFAQRYGARSWGEDYMPFLFDKAIQIAKLSRMARMALDLLQTKEDPDV